MPVSMLSCSSFFVGSDIRGKDTDGELRKESVWATQDQLNSTARRPHGVRPSKGRARPRPNVFFEDAMTTSSIILAMAQKRSRCESRTIHHLRRSYHRTDCVAAVDQHQREVMV